MKWDEWTAGPKLADFKDFDDGVFSEAVNTWFAGAEVELGTVFGTVGTEMEGAYSGIGGGVRTIWDYGNARFRDAPDHLGQLGQRLTWTAKGLHLITIHGVIIQGGGRRADASIDVLARLGHRARSFRRERLVNMDALEDADARAALRAGLAFLAAAVRPRHGARPHILRCAMGEAQAVVGMAVLHRDAVQEHVLKLARARQERSRRAVRMWARMATEGQAHAATKPPEPGTQNSASASKSHLGEMTAQAGADRGKKEWGSLWKATEQDQSETIMKAIEAMEYIGDALPEIPMPPFSEDRIFRIGGRFKGGTGLGSCNLRPRHVRLISRAARTALAGLLTAIERVGRWPSDLRWIIAVALGKKAGGARLIGLSGSIYRLWAKLRYADCRTILEQRIARPFLTAAPGRGAERTVFEASLTAETAHADGNAVAATTVDIKQFYEYVTVAEIASGALRQGVPLAVVLLSAHLYLGPRVIRVRKAVSDIMFPQRSVVAGCSWATVHVRVMLLPAMDVFVSQVKRMAESWEVSCKTSLYVDDGILTTVGKIDAVVFVHVWATKLLLDFITMVLHKAVAKGKLVCIASSALLRDHLAKALGPAGFSVGMAGELLGADFLAGRRATTRKVERKRLHKALLRKGRIKWLQNHGGDARQVVKGGVRPSVAYAASSLGIRPLVRRRLRRMQAMTTRVSCGGSSLTARLAIGGRRHEDVDPEVLGVNPPFIALLKLMWDEPRHRQGIVRAWRAFHHRYADAAPGQAWAGVRGPVSAAYAHLKDIEARWPHPFVAVLLDVPVRLLEIPPLQIVAILKAHARRHLDLCMIERLSTDRGWPAEAVAEKYRHGIDWKTVRDALEGRILHLSALEKRGLEVLCCNGFWSDERRWKAGYQGHASCRMCGWEVGSQTHLLHAKCGAMAWHLTQRRASGLAGQIPQGAVTEGLEPLLQLGLPPMTKGWRPTPQSEPQGFLSQGDGSDMFGDGSGYHQNDVRSAVSTWAVVRLRTADCGSGEEVVERARGLVHGWFPTVPRAELTAVAFALRHAPPEGRYIGDCSHVIDGASNQVPLHLRSSTSFNADIWREIHTAIMDIGDGISFKKTKAHRSREAASGSTDDGVWFWRGNFEADQYCKDLAKTAAAGDQSRIDGDRARATAEETIEFLAASMAWTFRNGGEAEPPRVRRAARPGGAEAEHRVGAHVVVNRRGGGVSCTVCHLCSWTMAGKRWLRQKPCRGSIADQAHASHQLVQGIGIVWCSRCGAYTSRIPRLLREECKGVPRTEAQRNVRRRLAAGLPPTTSTYHRALAEGHGRDGGARSPGVARDFPVHGCDAGADVRDDHDDGGAAGSVGVAGPPPPPGGAHVRAEEAPGAARVPRDEKVARRELAGRLGVTTSHYLRLEERRAQEREGGRVRAGFEEGEARIDTPGPAAAKRRAVSLDPPQCWCRPVRKGGWAARLRASTVAKPLNCHVCGSACRSVCRGCLKHLCMRCSADAVFCAP